MASEYKTIRRVEFADTDMAGIVHFAEFFRYMESVEHDFWRSMGLSIFTTIDGESYTFPRVHVECDFLSPLRFEDEVEIALRVREIRTKAITYSFSFRKVESLNREVARGIVTVVCVRRDPRTGEFQSAPIPPVIRSRIEVAPASESEIV